MRSGDTQINVSSPCFLRVERNFFVYLHLLRFPPQIYIFENNIYYQADVRSSSLRITSSGRDGRVFNGLADWLYEGHLLLLLLLDSLYIYLWNIDPLWTPDNPQDDTGCSYQLLPLGVPAGSDPNRKITSGFDFSLLAHFLRAFQNKCLVRPLLI